MGSKYFTKEKMSFTLWDFNLVIEAKGHLNDALS